MNQSEREYAKLDQHVELERQLSLGYVSQELASAMGTSQLKNRKIFNKPYAKLSRIDTASVRKIVREE